MVYLRKKNAVSTGVTTGLSSNVALDSVGDFEYTGNCPADIYLEAGIDSHPLVGLLAALPDYFNIPRSGQPSNCDGNKHYYGKLYTQVKPNEHIKFRLNPESYGLENTYPVNIGAYWGGTRTGCINFGGSTLAEIHSSASFSDSYNVFNIPSSYEIVT